MRLWVFTIWNEATGGVLQTAGPRENAQFERLIAEYGEAQAALAWYLYVNATPSPYNLEPVKHAYKRVSKAGKPYIQEAEDGSAITRFPLSAFLAVNEGYIVQACLDIDAPKPSRAKHEVLKHLKRRTPSLKRAWATESEDE